MSVGSTGFVDQKDRDVVAHRVGQSAAGAHQLLGLRLEARTARGTDDDLEQGGVELHRSLLIRESTSSRIRDMVWSSRPSTLRRSRGSVLEARTLNHQSSRAAVNPSRWSISAPWSA